jgi:ribose transport system ATP-binding protein/rhamnose transport system ATP-binding protein
VAAILKLHGISKHFPGVQALRDVSFDIEAGSIHAILGENGAGKSTLMQVIAGVYQPDSGQVEWRDQVVHFSNPAEAQADGIAIVYQELTLAPNLSIAENIFLGLEPRKQRWFLDRPELRSGTQTVLKRLGIDLDPDRIVKTLTIAQQQLIEICKSLIRHPRLLILDEPTSSLSASESALLFRVIADLKAEGVTIAYISHRLPEVFALSDRITILRDGQHVRTLATKETNETEVVRLMVKRELFALHRTKAPLKDEAALQI